MKAELDVHLRLRFYAQYLFQEVVELPNIVYVGNPPEPSHDEWSMSMLEPEMLRKIVNAQFPLFLRNINSITEEEAIEVAKIMKIEKSDFATDQFIPYRSYVGDKKDSDVDWNRSFSEVGRAYLSYFFRNEKWPGVSVWYCEQKLIIQVSDYLRSIGIAIPFMGNSVEDLVSAGWIILTNPPA